MESKKPAVGFVGLGIMGTALSANLIKAGFPVVGYDIAAQRMDELKRNGGSAAQSARDVAQRCEIILTSLPSAAALAATVSGGDGLLAARRKGLLVSECSTLALEDKFAAHAALAAGGITLLDSPLSGTGAQAARKDLLVFSSGERAAYDRMLPVYEGFARGSHYLGAFGNGSRMKFVANLLVSIHNVAAAEAMVLAMKAGLDPAETFKVISNSGGTSRMFEVRGPSMVAGDYSQAQIRLDLWMKDLSIIANFAASLRCPTPLFSASAPYYSAALAQGRESEDTGAVCAVLEGLAGVRRK
jgi:3-hydroxyisobutyrate dehydrogenase-like beta-hydroxyacid dehydrogenase